MCIYLDMVELPMSPASETMEDLEDLDFIDDETILDSDMTEIIQVINSNWEKLEKNIE